MKQEPTDDVTGPAPGPSSAPDVQMPQEPPNKKCALEELFVEEDSDIVITHVEPAIPLTIRVQHEITNYRAFPPIKSGEDPLMFWKLHEEKLPCLASLAQKYMCIPGSSVASERIFSTAGDVISQERARMKPDKADKLIFLMKNTP